MATAGARVDVELAAPGEPGDGDVAAIGRALGAGPWFDVGSAPCRPRAPGAVWDLVDARGYGGVPARGRAFVHLGRGNRVLRRPVVLADGFGRGAVPVARLTGDGLVDALLGAGFDVVLVGFADEGTHLQANAGVFAECVRRAVAERVGVLPLVVGGVGTGGLIARYALAALEAQGADHQADVYLSCDTPHDGAWIPLVLQQLAYFFERFPGGVSGADVLRTTVVRQVLGAWVRDSKYSGAVESPLRHRFLADLRRVGWLPGRVRMVGVSSGTGDGTASVPPGGTAFEWRLGELAGATALFQPERGSDSAIGAMSAAGEIRLPTTSGVPAFDGAPGGTADFFGQAADVLGAEIAADRRRGCFVPSTSAAALSVGDPYSVVGDGPFHEFRCSAQNLPHGRVGGPVADWILDRLA